MAQKQNLTFITEDTAPATSFIQSGKGLRKSYLSRQEAKYITEKLLAEEDPNLISEREWGELRDKWKIEAEIAYPDEGNYKVWLIDPVSELPVPLGELVEFIGGTIRENPGILPCKEYILDLSGEVIPDPTTFMITVIYTDCTIAQVTISETADKLDSLLICVGQNSVPTTTSGVFNEVGPCENPL